MPDRALFVGAAKGVFDVFEDIVRQGVYVHQHAQRYSGDTAPMYRAEEVTVRYVREADTDAAKVEVAATGTINTVLVIVEELGFTPEVGDRFRLSAEFETKPWADDFPVTDAMQIVGVVMDPADVVATMTLQA